MQVNSKLNLHLAGGDKTLRNDTAEGVSVVGATLCMDAEAPSETHGHWTRKFRSRLCKRG